MKMKSLPHVLSEHEHKLFGNRQKTTTAKFKPCHTTNNHASISVRNIQPIIIRFSHITSLSPLGLRIGGNGGRIKKSAISRRENVGNVGTIQRIEDEGEWLEFF
jgi:hypothetical protein